MYSPLLDQTDSVRLTLDLWTTLVDAVVEVVSNLTPTLNSFYEFFPWFCLCIEIS